MKKVLLYSLLLNAVFLAALVVEPMRLHRLDAPPARADLPAAIARPDSAKVRDAVRIGMGWRQWIEPLRQAAVPTPVLAGLVQADFDRRWQGRQAALQERYMRGEIDGDGLAAASIQHDIELERELQAALGPTEFRTWDMDRILGGLNVKQAQLSEQERTSVYDLERSLQDDLRHSEADKLNGAIDTATSQAQEKKAQGAVAQKLRDLLGAERAGQLQGMDDTLGTLRRSLQGVPIDDSQLERLAENQRQWDRARSALITEQVETQDPMLNLEIESAAGAWRANIESIAGPDGFDTFRKLQDSRYVSLRRNAARWGVAPCEIEKIFATLSDYDETVQEYRQDATMRDVDGLAVSEAEQQFSQQTGDALRSTIGDAAYARLSANGLTPIAPN